MKKNTDNEKFTQKIICINFTRPREPIKLYTIYANLTMHRLSRSKGEKICEGKKKKRILKTKGKNLRRGKKNVTTKGRKKI